METGNSCQKLEKTAKGSLENKTELGKYKKKHNQNKQKSRPSHLYRKNRMRASSGWMENLEETWKFVSFDPTANWAEKTLRKSVKKFCFHNYPSGSSVLLVRSHGYTYK